MIRDDGQGRIGLEARLYWGDRLLESASIDRGELRKVEREGARVGYVTRGRGVPLARLAGGRAIVSAPPGLVVEVRRGEGERWSGPEAELGFGAVARIVDGPLVHELRRVERPERARGGFVPGLDLGFARRLVSSGLVAAAVIAAMFVVSLEDFGLADKTLPRKYVAVIHEQPARPPPPVFQLPRPTLPTFHQRVEPAATTTGAVRDRNQRLVRDSGILLALRQLGGDGGGVFSAGMGAGINNAIEALHGDGSGSADLHGLAAMGPRGGSGLPGGGLGIGSITGGNLGGRRPTGFVLPGGGNREAVRVNPGKVTVVGGLSKDVIGKAIRAKERQVVACYERELQKAPDLEGKLAVSFVIDGTGHVAEVSVLDDTLGEPEVARCVAAKIRGWVFPAPDGGGQVVVNYPWIFRAAGVE